MEEKIKIYKMNDYEWYASKWDIQKTNDWYARQIEDNEIEDIKECDLDNEGMWYVTEDAEDLEKLGDSDELCVSSDTSKNHFGDLRRLCGDVYKYISFREAIKKDLNFTEPYCIACTEV